MKRSNEEFSTTVVEERQEQSEYGLQSSLQPTLKLSVKKAKQGLSAVKRLAYELTEYATQQDVLKVLVELERELPLQLHEEVEFALRTLWERLYEEKDTAVRAKIISLLGTLARFPGVNTVTVIEDFIKLLLSESKLFNIFDEEDKSPPSLLVFQYVFLLHILSRGGGYSLYSDDRDDPHIF